MRAVAQPVFHAPKPFMGKSNVGICSLYRSISKRLRDTSWSANTGYPDKPAVPQMIGIAVSKKQLFFDRQQTVTAAVHPPSAIQCCFVNFFMAG
jgi:hypothetical protein